MDRNEVISRAANIIHEECRKAGLEVERILLFGSRARGTASNQSDWDFFVGVDKEVNFPLKSTIASGIRTRLAETGVTADIIIKSWKRACTEADSVGFLSHYALSEGVAI